MKTKMNYKIGIPQLIISVYLVILISCLGMAEISLVDMINASLVKWCMNGVLVLSLVPMINIGAGRNFGLPVGICAGLIGMCIAIELRLTSWSGFIVAIFFSVLVGIIFGLLYSVVLNRMKGSEEVVGTFAGFAFIPIMNVFWTLAPFQNRQMLYPVGGQGLRPKISLNKYFGSVLDQAMTVEIGELIIPLGLILFFGLLCLIVHILLKTELGHRMSAIAENERFSKLTGVDVYRVRMYGIVLSTVLAAIGICVYAQSYGFVELYSGPFMMAFPAVSAILIGGATKKRATVLHVLLGTFLYQSTFLLSVPVANALLMPEMSEVARMIITNGIILYAFLHEGGKKRHEQI